MNNYINVTKYTPIGDGAVHARYEEINRKHVVYLEVANKVRRVVFPTHSAALNFIRVNLRVYGKLKDNI